TVRHGSVLRPRRFLNSRTRRADDAPWAPLGAAKTWDTAGSVLTRKGSPSSSSSTTTQRSRASGSDTSRLASPLEVDITLGSRSNVNPFWTFRMNRKFGVSRTSTVMGEALGLERTSRDRTKYPVLGT